MQNIVILEWTFTPENYFEEDMVLHDELYVLHITKGKIEARIDPVHYDVEHKTRYDLHQKVEAVFLARNLFIRQTYTLSTSTVYRLYSDGRRDGYAFAEGVSVCRFVSTADAITTDQNGNVICDTRRDRIEETNAFVRLVAKHDNDILLKTLLQSYNLAVEYSENEFIYLYEIRDALSKRFVGEKNTCTTLKILKTDWSYLGRLANEEPLTQGRHRGKKAPDLRNATREELNEARSICKKFIEAYLNYLEIHEI